jgi:hypothetical protein
MSVFSSHRPPPPPAQPSTVVAELATVQAAAQDRAQSSGLPAGQVTAAPHTHGRQS